MLSLKKNYRQRNHYTNVVSLLKQSLINKKKFFIFMNPNKSIILFLKGLFKNNIICGVSLFKYKKINLLKIYNKFNLDNKLVLNFFNLKNIFKKNLSWKHKDLNKRQLKINFEVIILSSALGFFYNQSNLLKKRQGGTPYIKIF